MFCTELLLLTDMKLSQMEDGGMGKSWGGSELVVGCKIKKLQRFAI